MKEKSYFEKREIACNVRLRNIIDQLPYYVEDFFIAIESRTSPLTRLNYGYDLRVFFDFLTKKVFRDKKVIDISLEDLSALQPTDFEYYLNYLNFYEINSKEERCTETGKARKLSSLRTFFKYLFNKNLIPSNNASKVLMPKIHEKEIIRLDSNNQIDEIGEMLYVVDSGSGLTKKQKEYHDATKIRDVAIITLFLGTGIRISELVGLNYTDVDFDTNSFIVTRKGGNRTVLYFNDEVKTALQNYVVTRTDIDQNKKNEDIPLFLSLQNKRIATRTIQELVKKYARIVTPLKKITPHKLRSTFGTNLYRKTGDIYVVADCLGHADVNTTKKHYAALSDDVRKKAVSSFHLSNQSQNDDDNK